MDESRYSIRTGVIPPITTADYVLFALTLVVSAVVGIYYAIRDRNRQTTDEFLLGGKSMSVFPVAMSLMVTFISALTLLGNPAEIYNYNTMFSWLAVSFIFAIAGAAYLFVPFFYRLEVLSTFEYLEMRFNKQVCLLASGLLFLQTMLYMAFLLYAPSLAINAVTGLNLWGCCVAMVVVVTLYTSLGGMKAVVWTDTFQSAVIFTGVLALLIQGSIVAGGFSRAWAVADSRARVVLDDFSVDPTTRHSVWSLVLGGMLYWCYIYGINQAQVQRCLSCPSVRKAQIALAINLPALVLIVTLSNMLGIIMFAFYADCHPIKYHLITTTDQLLPLYVMDTLGHLHGLPGMFISSLVSGSLSSLSSGMNALSTVVFRDFLQGTPCWEDVSEFRATLVSKLLVVAIGIVCLGLAWIVSQLGNILQAVYVVFGILNGPIMGVMTLGMLFPWANKWGAHSGVVASLILMLWIGMGAYANHLRTPASPTVATACNWTARPTAAPATTASPVSLAADTASSVGALEPLYRMSYMWYTGLGTLLVWFFGMIVSLLTGPTDPKSLDPRLILPIFDKLFPYLPEKILKPLRFGIVHEGKYERPAPTSTQAAAEKGSPRLPVSGVSDKTKNREGYGVTDDEGSMTSEICGVTNGDGQLDMQGQGSRETAY